MGSGSGVRCPGGLGSDMRGSQVIFKMGEDMIVRGIDFVISHVGDVKDAVAFYRDTLGIEAPLIRSPWWDLRRHRLRPAFRADSHRGRIPPERDARSFPVRDTPTAPQPADRRIGCV